MFTSTAILLYLQQPKGKGREGNQPALCTRISVLVCTQHLKHSRLRFQTLHSSTRMYDAESNTSTAMYSSSMYRLTAHSKQYTGHCCRRYYCCTKKYHTCITGYHSSRLQKSTAVSWAAAVGLLSTYTSKAKINLRVLRRDQHQNSRASCTASSTCTVSYEVLCVYEVRSII